jgi:hypothetical protein
MAEPNDPAEAGTDDVALFNEATTGPIETPDQPATPEPPKQEPAAPDPMVPSGRLREETEARRALERERDDLRRRLDDFMRPPQPKTEPPKRSDLFEAPSAFVQEEVRPLLDPVQSRIDAITEHYSLQNAISRHGDEKVRSAYKALESAMGARDSEAWSIYNRARTSIDPYGEIVRWHTSKEVISTVGGDLKAYREKLADEFLTDPEFQKRAYEKWRGQAASSGNNVSRPVVPKTISIGKVGTAAASSDTDENLSEEELFQAATRRR